ncbi:MAG: hypothetical protein HKM24_06655 [Gammaproteobacteria bacterium]|nr:hypothetical protein [Gammaproteobacteria bacterium]
MNTIEANAEALTKIEDHLSVIAAGHPIVKHGPLFEELCAAFQGRAIFFLLNELDIDHFVTEQD